jgi:hypothetical protein
MPKPRHIDLTDEFTRPLDGEPKVILTWTSDEFVASVYRIVFCAEERKYVKENRRVNAMGEQIWVFDEAWHADNHNNSISGFRLCELLRFLCT